MFLIVGLGNPKRKYKKTRHNIGFVVLDELQKENDFPKFKFEKKFNAEISIKNNTVLLKPQTFMNNSGFSVKAFLNYYKIPTQQITIVHDDLDFKIGEVKESENKGPGGHNGVKSVISQLGTKDFKRIRIGIRPTEGIESIKDFVLQKFSKEEEETLSNVKENVIKAITLT